VNDMFAHERRSPESDLSDWIGPLSPAFAAMRAENSRSDESPAAQSVAGAATGVDTASATSRFGEWIGASTPTHAPAQAAGAGARLDELRTLFHTLNNQLGVIITHAELLESKAPDEGLRARATEVLTAALGALGTSKQIRHTVIQ
jgi:hypothetical protein